MATEYKLPYTAFEINEKLETVDEIKTDLKDNYYTKDQTDASFEEVREITNSISGVIDGINDDLENNYYTKNQINESFENVEASLEEISGSFEAVDASLGEINAALEGVDASLEEMGELTGKMGESIDNINIDLENKADLVDGKIPMEQLPDDIGGGSAGLTEVTWEDIKNKPFGETGINIIWDGNITDKDHLGIVPGFDFYRISPKILSEDELLGTSISTYYSGGFLDGVISQDGLITISPTTNGNLIVMYGGQLPMLFVTSQLGEDSAFGQTFNVEFTGVWFLHSIGDDEYTHCIEKDFSIKKIDKEYLPDGIGGGVTSWNDLEDKPFGETGWAAVWDGNPETALEEPFDVPAMGAILYKVSAKTPSQEECVGSYVRYILSNEERVVSTIESAQPTDSEDCFVLMGDGMGLFTVALKDGSYNFMGIPFVLTAGVWSVVVTGAYTPLQLGESDVIKIDAKYLPDGIGEGLTDISWEDIKDKPFGLSGWEFTYDENKTYEFFDVPTMGATLYKIGEAKTKEELVGATGKYIFAGEEGEFVVDETCFQDCADNRAFVVMGNSMGLFAVSSEAIATEFMGISFSFPSAGTWNVCVSGAYTPTYLGNVEVKQIDKKFIPDDIVASVSLTFDEFPTEGSQNPVKSMGIHSAISALEGKITSTFCYKGTVANYADLPMDNNVTGDVWNIANADESHGVEAGDNAAWDGSSWDILAGVIDLSDYYTKTEIDSIALNGTVNLANYYTKREINDIIGDCNAVINSINTLIGGVGV